MSVKDSVSQVESSYRQDDAGEKSVSERINGDISVGKDGCFSLTQELADSKLTKGLDQSKPLTQSIDDYSEILADDSAVDNFFQKTQLLSQHLDVAIVPPPTPTQASEHHVLGTIRDIQPALPQQ